ncbi:MAG: bifunctional fucokinase/L-fucose-1-P-guanylyltransferase [Prevotella sp.]|nr:bifunctional fucokinase/L-fucose-1-P-guanylyltransferase [Prevotella sp.]
MKKLLSLPPNLVKQTPNGNTVFHEITGLPTTDYYCTCDPEGHRVGSGGGTAWLLQQAWENEESGAQDGEQSFDEWLEGEKRILVHAGGQSRRLPAYAPSGKALMPIPVFRWSRGQRIGQYLLSLQLPLYEQIMQSAPSSLHTMVVSGDVFIRTTQTLPPVPEADVVCYGLWLDASVATHHGVFLMDRTTPGTLKKMLQKPSVAELHDLQGDHFFLTDIGVWLLSDRAVKLLMERSGLHPSSLHHPPTYYDLYSDFGRCLGTDPQFDDPELRQLTVAVLPLTGGEFYHFGTSRDMIASTLRLQNVVSDQREIMHHDRKPHPSIFVQNAVTKIPFTAQNTNIWIENSYVGPHWQLTNDHIITGVPENDWHIALQPGECIDVVPIDDDLYALRRYHIDDRFDGDEQQREQFPVVTLDELHLPPSTLHHPLSTIHPHKSAEQLSSQARLDRLFAQREAFRAQNLPMLARNWQHSVFYQLDLDDVARLYEHHHLDLPEALPDSAPMLTRIHNAMLRGDSSSAFSLLREGLLGSLITHNSSLKTHNSSPLHSDQIVWARSPVRIDIAGGWTDTPPYCLYEGGRVVNLAVELGGQPPLQTYVKPSEKKCITLRSIDLGATEVVTTYEQLACYNQVGSPFSIPKAALALAGFLPQFADEHYATLQQQLDDLGCGIELTLLSAVPAGSGMGTSSILAATVLGALNDFCMLGWDKNELGRRTLMLEQLLTTGGGWQDQFGGLLGGVKLLESQRGFAQQPLVRWLPDTLFTAPEYRQCHLLYYTGITRTAKQILAEIVRRMFLNNHDQLRLLGEMRCHALTMYEAIQRQDFEQMGRLVGVTWQQNQQLDSGTNPPEVERLTRLVDDLCLGYKLPGAGGGGFLYMVAKDPEAAARIKRLLMQEHHLPNARFVDMQLSTKGLQVSRS